MINDTDEVTIELVINNRNDLLGKGLSVPGTLRYRNAFNEVPEPDDVIDKSFLNSTGVANLPSFKVISKVEVLENTADPRVELTVEGMD